MCINSKSDGYHAYPLDFPNTLFIFKWSIFRLDLNNDCFYALFYLYLWFQSDGSANMFYTCGPNEAMVVSGKLTPSVKTIYTKYNTAIHSM